MAHHTAIGHAKTLKFARLLGVQRCTAVGILECLWQYVHVTATNLDGCLNGLDPEDLPSICYWDGDGEKLTEALIASGFVDRTTCGLFVHDYADWCPKFVKQRVSRNSNRYVTDGTVKPQRGHTDAPKTRQDTTQQDKKQKTTTPGASPVGKESGRSGERETKPRKPDPVWDAVVAVFGFDAEHLSQGDAKKIGKLTRDFLARMNGEDPAVELRRRIANYREHFPGMSVTPHAIDKHWHQIATAPATAAPDWSKFE